MNEQDMQAACDLLYHHWQEGTRLDSLPPELRPDSFLLGPAAPEDWRKLDLAAHPGRALKNGALAGEGIGSNVLGGPVTALTWLANELSQHGMILGAGQVVTTGTCLMPLAIAA